VVFAPRVAPGAGRWPRLIIWRQCDVAGRAVHD